MSMKLKLKTAALIFIVAVGLIVMGVLIATMQGNLALRGYEEEMASEISEMPDLVASAETETEENTETYDAIYQSKAASVAYMANHDAGYEATDAKMAELAELMNVDNLLIVSRDGTVFAQAGETKADFSHARFNLLRTTFDTGEPSAAVAVQIDGENWNDRYYAARIDENTMCVVEQNPEELEALVAESSSAESLLKNMSVGQHGYVFSVSAKDYLIGYHPDDELVGADALDAGISAEQLEEGSYSWMTLNGERLYCDVTQVDDVYYIAAVPESDLNSSRIITVGIILFIFLVIMALVVIYGVCIMSDIERRRREKAEKNEGEDDDVDGASLPEETDAKDDEASGWRFNRKIARKAAALSLVGFVIVLVVAFYMQTLFALSSQTVSNNERAAAIQETIADANERAEELQEQYDERYLNKARVAGYIVDANPSLANKEDLQELSDTLQVQYLFVFDGAGVMTATNSTYANFTVSDDPEDQSYEFAKLLQGADSVVQEAQPDEISGELRQYIGVPLHNSTGTVEGFLQISIRPSRLENLLESVEIGNVLDGVKAGADGFAFAVNKSDNTFAYFPDEDLQGKDALSCGIEEGQLKDGFCGYVTIDGTSYYASCVEQGDYYLFVAGTEGELMAERGRLTLDCGIVAAVCLVLIFLILSFERPRAAYEKPIRKKKINDKKRGLSDDDPRMVDVVMPGGRKVRTESAASRWLGTSFKWHEKTPEAKVGTVMKALMGVFVLVMCLAVVFKDAIFAQSSIFAYILGGTWEYGINIFAITASIMFACVAMTVATIIQKLLRMLAGVLNARGETICRMVGSFIKYATIIGMLYYCLMLLGVDTTTLLASAGILSIAISFGAKELVSDIISGLFIIFEGEFRVGDIIKVGEWRGTVVEIGVRTTKVEDANRNIKVIRNSDVSNIINMTKRVSLATCDVSIEYNESLERVENVLSEELPGVGERNPAIVAGPFYKGVVDLGDNSVDIRIVAQCAEGDRVQLERDLKRELKLIFDRHDISMPFPQVVIHEAEERREITDWERQKAEYYFQDQRNLTREMGEDGSG